MTLSTRWLHLKKKYSGAHPRSSSRPIAGSQISSWHSPSSMECGKGGGVSHQEAVRRSHEVRPIHQGSHSLGHPLCPPSQPGTVPQNPTLQYWGWGRKQEVPHPHTPIGPSQPGIVPENPTHWSFRAHSRELLPPPPDHARSAALFSNPHCDLGFVALTRAPWQQSHGCASRQDISRAGWIPIQPPIDISLPSSLPASFI